MPGPIRFVDQDRVPALTAAAANGAGPSLCQIIMVGLPGMGKSLIGRAVATLAGLVWVNQVFILTRQGATSAHLLVSGCLLSLSNPCLAFKVAPSPNIVPIGSSIKSRPVLIFKPSSVFLFISQALF